MNTVKSTVCFSVFDTAWGPAGLAWTGRGVCGLILPGRPVEHAVASIKEHYPEARPVETGKEHPAARKVQAYFGGKAADLAVKVDLFYATPFEEMVYRELMKIPRGRTASYGDVARALGKPGASRAVGAANAKNRVPLIIPCHRVIAANGGLGGFSAPGGMKTKQKLLELEGVGHGRK